MLLWIIVSRFEVIPTGVTRTKLISVKPLILFNIPQSIWLFECTEFYLSYMSVCVSVCTSVRASHYITTFVTFHVWFYDWLISIIIRYLSCPHHLNKFSNVLTAYVIWYDSFVLKKSFIIELVYLSLMSNPCKWTHKCVNCKPVNIYAFFISHEKYVSVINTEFAISIMSTPTKLFPFSVRYHFY